MMPEEIIYKPELGTDGYYRASVPAFDAQGDRVRLVQLRRTHINGVTAPDEHPSWLEHAMVLAVPQPAKPKSQWNLAIAIPKWRVPTGNADHTVVASITDDVAGHDTVVGTFIVRMKNASVTRFFIVNTYGDVAKLHYDGTLTVLYDVLNQSKYATIFYDQGPGGERYLFYFITSGSNLTRKRWTLDENHDIIPGSEITVTPGYAAESGSIYHDRQGKQFLQFSSVTKKIHQFGYDLTETITPVTVPNQGTVPRSCCLSADRSTIYAVSSQRLHFAPFPDMTSWSYIGNLGTNNEMDCHHLPNVGASGTVYINNVEGNGGYYLVDLATGVRTTIGSDLTDDVYRIAEDQENQVLYYGGAMSFINRVPMSAVHNPRSALEKIPSEGVYDSNFGGAHSIALCFD